MDCGDTTEEKIVGFSFLGVLSTRFYIQHNFFMKYSVNRLTVITGARIRYVRGAICSMAELPEKYE